MEKVKIVTDSVAGISPELAKQYNIAVIPGALINYDGTTYIDGVTLSREDAYGLIKKDPDRFTTSAVSPGYIMNEYKEIAKQAAKIVHITMASVLSANNKTANLAAESFQKESPDIKIKVLDSKSAAGAQGLIVLEAAKAAEEGKGIDEIEAIVQQTREKTGGIMLWDTLRYVYRTGRMSKVAARLISLLNIKPISRITDEGNVDLVERVRKREDGYNKMIEMIREETGEKPVCFMIMHANSPKWADDFSKLVKKNFNCQDIIISEYSPVMGYATGPGAVFVGYRRD